MSDPKARSMPKDETNEPKLVSWHESSGELMKCDLYKLSKERSIDDISGGSRQVSKTSLTCSSESMSFIIKITESSGILWHRMGRHFCVRDASVCLNVQYEKTMDLPQHFSFLKRFHMRNIGFSCIHPIDRSGSNAPSASSSLSCACF